MAGSPRWVLIMQRKISREHEMGKWHYEQTKAGINYHLASKRISCVGGWIRTEKYNKYNLNLNFLKVYPQVGFILKYSFLFAIWLN